MLLRIMLLVVNVVAMTQTAHEKNGRSQSRHLCAPPDPTRPPTCTSLGLADRSRSAEDRPSAHGLLITSAKVLFENRSLRAPRLDGAYQSPCLTSSGAVRCPGSCASCASCWSPQGRLSSCTSARGRSHAHPRSCIRARRCSHLYNKARGSPHIGLWSWAWARDSALDSAPAQAWRPPPSCRRVQGSQSCALRTTRRTSPDHTTPTRRNPRRVRTHLAESLEQERGRRAPLVELSPQGGSVPLRRPPPLHPCSS